MPRCLSFGLILLVLVSFYCTHASADKRTSDHKLKWLQDNSLILEYLPNDEVIAKRIWPRLIASVETQPDSESFDAAAVEKLKRTKEQALQFIAFMAGLDRPTDGMRTTYDGFVNACSGKIGRYRLCHKEEENDGLIDADRVAAPCYDSSKDTVKCTYDNTAESKSDYIPIILTKDASAEKVVGDAI